MGSAFLHIHQGPPDEELPQQYPVEFTAYAQQPDGEFCIVNGITRFIITQSREVGKQAKQKDGEDGEIKYEVMLKPGPAITKLEIERSITDNMAMPKAFGQNFIFLSDQFKPFDLKVIYVTPYAQITVHYHNCWFETYVSHVIDDKSFQENAKIVCELSTITRQPLA